MFNKGDYVIHEGNGVCEVTDIVELALGGKGSEKKYYSLTPFFDKTGHVFTPVNSDKVRIRPVMTKEEVDDLIKDMPEIDVIWEKDDKARGARFKECIASCEPARLVETIKTIYQRKQLRIQEGKKVLSGDVKFLQMAEKKLFGEIAFVLSIEYDQVEKYILNSMDNEPIV